MGPYLPALVERIGNYETTVKLILARFYYANSVLNQLGSYPEQSGTFKKVQSSKSEGLGVVEAQEVESSSSPQGIHGSNP